VYLPGYESPREAKVWPGVVLYRGARWGNRPLGLSVELKAAAELAEAADLVRAEARGMSYEWVRQRLALELLVRGEVMPPGIVDQAAEGITFTGPAGWARRAVRARRRSVATSWLAVRSIFAWALRRPLPHWHIFGFHAVAPSPWGTWLEVAVDPWAGELLAVGDSDKIAVWLGLSRETFGPDSIVVYRGDYRLGVLTDGDGGYRAILAEPRHEHTNLVTDATRSRADDGSWRLRIGSPR
jgi:hypothetical protein